jgi:hypothetical protein
MRSRLVHMDGEKMRVEERLLHLLPYEQGQSCSFTANTEGKAYKYLVRTEV